MKLVRDGIWFVLAMVLCACPGTWTGSATAKTVSSQGEKRAVSQQHPKALSVEQRKQQGRAKKSARADQQQRPVAQDSSSHKLEHQYPGIFQRPERQNSRSDRNHDGQVDPWEREIAEERFRQLDRNRDGIVDPMERALDLVDLDRYGRTGPLQQEPTVVHVQAHDTPVTSSERSRQSNAAWAKPGSKSHVQRVERPARLEKTPSSSPRRQARAVPRKESSSSR